MALYSLNPPPGGGEVGRVPHVLRELDHLSTERWVQTSMKGVIPASSEGLVDVRFFF